MFKQGTVCYTMSVRQPGFELSDIPQQNYTVNKNFMNLMKWLGTMGVRSGGQGAMPPPPDFHI